MADLDKTAMTDKLSETYSVSIPAGQYWSLQLPVTDIEGFYIFEVDVEQKRRVLDDVRVEVMDDDNAKLWDFRLSAIRAGARAGALPSYTTFTSAKLAWGTLSFRPPSLGRYHIILDNSHSTHTPKDVILKAYWVPQEWLARRAVREATARLGWTEAWRLFTQAEVDLENGKLSNSCDNMRKALLVLWVNVCEALSKKSVMLDAGKSPDVGVLKEKLSPYAADYVIGQLSHVWSMSSELAHIEKRGGKEPPLNEVIYALRLVYSSAAFLVSLVPPSS